MKYKTLVILFVFSLIAGILLAQFNFKPSKPISSYLPELVFPKSQPNPLTIILTGDVMLGRSVNTRIQKYADPTWPFKNIASTLQNSDLTIINLEAPFITGCLPTDIGMIFCANPESVNGLKYAGVDVATIANNHLNDQGQKGVDETISILKANEIAPVNSTSPYFSTIKNSKVAVLAYSDLPQMDKNIFAKQIAESRNSADIVIVAVHWGYEYQNIPNTRQKLLAHLAIDSGADVVVGHHPHWIQSSENYQGKPIFYSLGNLVFDQMWSEETRLGNILKLTFERNVLTKNEIFPIKIIDYGQPAIISSTIITP